MKNYLSPIEEIIKEAKTGKMFILVDAEDRENEGDLVIPAVDATPDMVNFMAKYGRGLVCLPLSEEKADIFSALRRYSRSICSHALFSCFL